MIQAMRTMYVSTLTIGTTGLCESFIPSVYTQCVRWKRKPIWLPTAKSKVFRVPKRPVIPREEILEIQRLYNNYRTYMTSLKTYLLGIVKENEVQFDETVIQQAEEKDFQECSIINDKWNAEVAKERNVRLIKMREEQKNVILQKLLKIEKKQEMQKKEINERIRKTKEEALTFITAETVDTAIEDCLANIVDHNRALDLEGNWYDGKYPPVSTLEHAKSSADQTINLDSEN